METINALNHNKFFAGFAMLLLIKLSKYITVELSETQEEFLQNTIMKIYTIYCILKK